jgi:hypothetical protein
MQRAKTPRRQERQGDKEVQLQMERRFTRIEGEGDFFVCLRIAAIHASWGSIAFSSFGALGVLAYLALVPSPLGPRRRYKSSSWPLCLCVSYAGKRLLRRFNAACRFAGFEA